MSTFRTIRFAVVSIALTNSFASVSLADTFRNGQSIYGQPSSEAAQARVVDVVKTKYANVTYGETIVFQGTGDQKFLWTFNGLDASAWNLAKFAPASLLAGKDYWVYVSKNPLYRR